MLQMFKYERAIQNLLETAIFLRDSMPNASKSILEIAQDVMTERNFKREEQAQEKVEKEKTKEELQEMLEKYKEGKEE